MDKENNLGEQLRQRRIACGLTRVTLETASGISTSHIRRIERGERFPSGKVLRKLAGPLSLSESDLLVMAGFMSAEPEKPQPEPVGQVDPLVVRLLAQEPVEVQRTVISLLFIMKSIGTNLRDQLKGT